MDIREKKHRLPGEFYKGHISVAFTLCLKKDAQLFTKHEIVKVFTDALTSIAIGIGCIVPVYCFMPNHQHLIVTGIRSDSDIWKMVVGYKQKTGFRMLENTQGIRWQKDFYDHIIRKSEDMAVQVRYILNNPVRKSLVSTWNEYPFKGSIGCKLEYVLNNIM